MQTIKIPLPVPDGYEIDTFDKTSRSMTIKPSATRDPNGRPGTFDEVLADNGLTWEDFNKKTVGDDDDDIAYKQAKLIAKALNQRSHPGRKPDWNNRNEQKYFPWFYMGSSGFRFYVVGTWDSYSHVGSRLSYFEDEDAKYAATNFTDIFKRLMVWE